MSNDVKGYYAQLNVVSTASATEIKDAFRRLAKELHPDSGKVDDGGARFRLATEAYKILSDPNSRADYDSFCAASVQSAQNHQGTSLIKPIVCSVCGLVTAQPRYIVFRRVVSVIFTTMRTPVQGIYCSSCAKKTALTATLISAVAGWWGIPWGPIYTILDGMRNALGGASSKKNEEMLLWHNALAFARTGQEKISYALAERLRSAADREIATNAVRLQDMLEANGIAKVPALIDPWAASPTTVVPHLLLIAALPAVLCFAIYASDGATVTSNGPYVTAEAPYSPPPTDAGSSDMSADPANDMSADPSISNSSDTLPSVADSNVPTCQSPPSNGRILSGGSNLNRQGHVLEIQNGSGGDAIIKLRNSAGAQNVVAAFFVANNRSANLSGIPDGSYVIQYAFGQSLAADCKSFAQIEAAGQFPDAETLLTEKIDDLLGTNIKRTRVSYTLYPVPAGNVHPRSLDPSAFNAD